MLKHEVTAERYRELTRDKIERYVGSSILGPEVDTLGFFASPRGGVVGILMVKSGQPRDHLNRRPWRYFEHKGDKFFFISLIREADDQYHYLKQSGERGNRELCSNELIALIDEFIERKCDNPFIVGGDCDGGRGPFPEHDKKILGREQLQIVERNTERLAKRTRDRYGWNAADEKWHFARQDIEFTSYDRSYEIVYLKCGTVSEIRKSPKTPLGSDDCQFRINGGPWYRYMLPMGTLREHLRSAKAAEMIDGFELAEGRWQQMNYRPPPHYALIAFCSIASWGMDFIGIAKLNDTPTSTAFSTLCRWPSRRKTEASRGLAPPVPQYICGRYLSGRPP